MAQLLQLYYNDGGLVEPGAITVNLLDGVFSLADGGWETEDADEPVWETFLLLVKGTDAQIRTEQKNLDKLIEYARQFTLDDLLAFPVSLEVQSEGESKKVCYILDGEVSYEADDSITPLLGANLAGGDTGQIVVLTLLRTPAWEVPDGSGTFLYTDNISTSGGTWTPAGSAAGTLDQRIAKFVISDDVTPIYEHNKFWIGWRRPRYGLTNFQSTFEAETGDAGTDWTGSADVGASNGWKATIDFSTVATLALRAQFRLSQMSSNTKEMIGKYLILGRVKLDAGTTEVRLQLRQGFLHYSTVDYEVIGDSYLSAVSNPNLTNWNVVELGFIKVPNVGNRGERTTYKSGTDYYGFELQAERLSGSGSIDIDCFYFIPTDHFVILDKVKVSSDAGETHVYTSELNEQYAIGAGYNVGSQAFDHMYSINYQIGNWFYPAMGGKMVIVGQQTAQHELGKTVDIQMTVFPRFKSFRV